MRGVGEWDSSLKQVKQIHDPGLFESGYSQSSHHKQDFKITRSKTSYSLIEPQPLPSTPASDYEFHALAVHPHTTFTAPPVRSAFGIQSEVCDGAFCRNSLRIKAADCFRRGAPSLMFDGMLNATLSESKVSTSGATQGNLDLLLPPNSPASHQTQI